MGMTTELVTTILIQTATYALAFWKFIDGLRRKITDLSARLEVMEKATNLRLEAVERKDDEISRRLDRIETLLIDIRLELKDKADRNG
jgi:hypothetical protein